MAKAPRILIIAGTAREAKDLIDVMCIDPEQVQVLYGRDIEPRHFCGCHNFSFILTGTWRSSACSFDIVQAVKECVCNSSVGKILMETS